MESVLTQNISACIQNDKFQKLPISFIYRIFEKSSPEKIDHDMLYEFISKSIETRHVLYKFVDIQKLSSGKFDEMYHFYKNNSEVYFRFLPNNLDYIKQFKESQKLLEEEIKKLKQMNENLQSQQAKALSDNSELQSQLTQLKDSQKLIEDKVRKMNEDNESLRKEQAKALSDNSELQRQLAQCKERNVQKERDDIQMQNQKLLKEKEKQGIEFKYTSNFNGIINSLNEKCGGNCSEKGIINVMCSKIQGSQKSTNLTNLSDLYTNTWIDCELNGYFEFDFKDKKVIITDYEFQTPDSGENNSYPKNWSIECSDDQNEWFVIDRKTNDEHLHGPAKHYVFKVNNPISKPCRYVRIYQRGYSHYSKPDYYFGLSTVEFYGNLCY